MTQQAFIDQLTTLGKQILPKDASLWLYGSRARGDARDDSDWDLLILLNKERIESYDYDRYVFPLSQIGWSTNTDVRPVLYTRSEWNCNAGALFYHNVSNDKLELI